MNQNLLFMLTHCIFHSVPENVIMVGSGGEPISYFNLRKDNFLIDYRSNHCSQGIRFIAWKRSMHSKENLVKFVQMST